MWFWYALGAAVIVAVLSAVEKKVLRREHALSFSAGHALIVLLLSLPLLLLADFSVFTSETLILLYCASWLAAFAFWLGLRGTKHLDLSVSSPLSVSSLAFLPILAFFFVGERLNSGQIAGIGLIFLGVVALELIVHHGKLFPIISTKGKERYFSFVLLSSFLFAVTAIIDKIILSTWNPFTFLLAIHFFISFNSLILMWVLDDNFKRDLKQLFSQDLKMVVLTSALSLAHRFLMSIAIAGSFVSTAVAIKKLSALFATILGGTLFYEKNVTEKIVISLVMIVGAALLALS